MIQYWEITSKKDAKGNLIYRLFIDGDSGDLDLILMKFGSICGRPAKVSPPYTYSMALIGINEDMLPEIENKIHEVVLLSAKTKRTSDEEDTVSLQTPAKKEEASYEDTRPDAYVPEHETGTKETLEELSNYRESGFLDLADVDSKVLGNVPDFAELGTPTQQQEEIRLYDEKIDKDIEADYISRRESAKLALQKAETEKKAEETEEEKPEEETLPAQTAVLSEEEVAPAGAKDEETSHEESTLMDEPPTLPKADKIKEDSFRTTDTETTNPEPTQVESMLLAAVSKITEEISSIKATMSREQEAAKLLLEEQAANFREQIRKAKEEAQNAKSDLAKELEEAKATVRAAAALREAIEKQEELAAEEQHSGETTVVHMEEQTEAQTVEEAQPVNEIILPEETSQYTGEVTEAQTELEPETEYIGTIEEETLPAETASEFSEPAPEEQLTETETSVTQTTQEEPLTDPDSSIKIAPVKEESYFESDASSAEEAEPEHLDITPLGGDLPQNDEDDGIDKEELAKAEQQEDFPVLDEEAVMESDNEELKEEFEREEQLADEPVYADEAEEAGESAVSDEEQPSQEEFVHEQPREEIIAGPEEEPAQEAGETEPAVSYENGQDAQEALIEEEGGYVLPDEYGPDRTSNDETADEPVIETYAQNDEDTGGEEDGEPAVVVYPETASDSERVFVPEDTTRYDTASLEPETVIYSEASYTNRTTPPAEESSSQEDYTEYFDPELFKQAAVNPVFKSDTNGPAQDVQNNEDDAVFEQQDTTMDIINDGSPEEELNREALIDAYAEQENNDGKPAMEAEEAYNAALEEAARVEDVLETYENQEMQEEREALLAEENFDNNKDTGGSVDHEYMEAAAMVQNEETATHEPAVTMPEDAQEVTGNTDALMQDAAQTEQTEAPYGEAFGSGAEQTTPSEEYVEDMNTNNQPDEMSPLSQETAGRQTDFEYKETDRSQHPDPDIQPLDPNYLDNLEEQHVYAEQYAKQGQEEALDSSMEEIQYAQDNIDSYTETFSAKLDERQFALSQLTEVLDSVAGFESLDSIRRRKKREKEEADLIEEGQNAEYEDNLETHLQALEDAISAVETSHQENEAGAEEYNESARHRDTVSLAEETDTSEQQETAPQTAAQTSGPAQTGTMDAPMTLLDEPDTSFKLQQSPFKEEKKEAEEGTAESFGIEKETDTNFEETYPTQADISSHGNTDETTIIMAKVRGNVFGKARAKADKEAHEAEDVSDEHEPEELPDGAVMQNKDGEPVGSAAQEEVTQETIPLHIDTAQETENEEEAPAAEPAQDDMSITKRPQPPAPSFSSIHAPMTDDLVVTKRLRRHADRSQVGLAAATKTNITKAQDDNMTNEQADNERSKIESMITAAALTDSLPSPFAAVDDLPAKEEDGSTVRRKLSKKVREAYNQNLEEADNARQKKAEAAKEMEEKFAAEQKQKQEAAANPEGDVEAMLRARIEAEYQAKLEEERKSKEELAAKIKAQAEAEFNAKLEEERKAKEELQAKIKAEEEAKQKALDEAQAKSKLEEEYQAKLEEERKAREELQAKIKDAAEAQRKAEEEAEAKAKKIQEEAEEKARQVQAEAEEKARKLQEELEARTQKEKAEEEAKRKAQEKAKELEAKAQELARAKAQADREKSDRERAAMEKKSQEEIEAQIRAKAEAELRAKLEAEFKAKLEEERKAKEELAEKIKQEEEKRAKLEEESKARIEAQYQAKLEEERKAKEELEQKARLEEERMAKMEAEFKAKIEAEYQAKLDEERKAKEALVERARLEEERRLKVEEEIKAKIEAEYREKIEAERKVKEELEEQLKDKERSRLRLKSEEESRLKAQLEARAKEVEARVQELARAKELAEERAKKEKLLMEMEQKARELEARSQELEKTKIMAEERAQQEKIRLEVERRAKELQAKLEEEARKRIEMEERAAALEDEIRRTKVIEEEKLKAEQIKAIKSGSKLSQIEAMRATMRQKIEERKQREVTQRISKLQANNVMATVRAERAFSQDDSTKMTLSDFETKVIEEKQRAQMEQEAAARREAAKEESGYTTPLNPEDDGKTEVLSEVLSDMFDGIELGSSQEVITPESIDKAVGDYDATINIDLTEEEVVDPSVQAESEPPQSEPAQGMVPLLPGTSGFNSVDELLTQVVLDEDENELPASTVRISNKPLTIAYPLNHELTFANMITATNRFAHAASISVIDSPGTMYNPLFLFGPSGTGKTHFMHAIANDLLRERNMQNLLITDGLRLSRGVQQLIFEKRVDAFNEMVNSSDALFIDDIHLTSISDDNREYLSRLLNAFKDLRKQIIITSVYPPTSLSRLEQALGFTLNDGWVVELKRPQGNHYSDIIKNNLKNRNIMLSSEELSDCFIDPQPALSEVSRMLTGVQVLQDQLSNTEVGIDPSGFVKLIFSKTDGAPLPNDSQIAKMEAEQVPTNGKYGRLGVFIPKGEAKYLPWVSNSFALQLNQLGVGGGFYNVFSCEYDTASLLLSAFRIAELCYDEKLDGAIVVSPIASTIGENKINDFHDFVRHMLESVLVSCGWVRFEQMSSPQEYLRAITELIRETKA